MTVTALVCNSVDKIQTLLGNLGNIRDHYLYINKNVFQIKKSVLFKSLRTKIKILKKSIHETILSTNTQTLAKTLKKTTRTFQSKICISILERTNPGNNYKCTPQSQCKSAIRTNCGTQQSYQKWCWVIELDTTKMTLRTKMVNSVWSNFIIWSPRNN
jgi:hypothetical protein